MRICFALSPPEARVPTVSEKKEITVETERLLIIRRRYQAVEAWCETCDRLSIMIRPDQAAAVTGRTLREIFNQIERGTLHFHEPPDGLLLICLDSLLGTQFGLTEEQKSVPPP